MSRTVGIFSGKFNMWFTPFGPDSMSIARFFDCSGPSYLKPSSSAPLDRPPPPIALDVRDLPGTSTGAGSPIDCVLVTTFLAPCSAITNSNLPDEEVIRIGVVFAVERAEFVAGRESRDRKGRQAMLL